MRIDRGTRRLGGALGTLLLLATTLVAVANPAPALAVIVVGAGGRQAVEAAGGEVTASYSTLDIVAADVPADRVEHIRSAPGVRSVAPDREVELASTAPEAYDPGSQYGSLWWLGEMTGAHALWRDGITGAGVDVAMIDSGVVPVPGLDDETHVLHGPDVSFESGYDDLRHLDTFGHGTHLGGIIAARDGRGVDPDDPDRVQGLAPDARLVSIKAADQYGVADVAQILAAFDWVIAHHDADGLNIRVLNLSFATDSPLGYVDDPLSYAVEQAWRHGIVVVVAAGNLGNVSAELPIPARNPFVIAAGALDSHDTATAADDTVASFSARGSSSRKPDVLAPGTHIISLRDPGSYLDEQYPGARIGETMMRGSGTSQAAAVVSGLAALVVQAHPSYGPDQIKALLTRSADPLSSTSTLLQGSGVVDADDAAGRSFLFPFLVRQSYTASTGGGSLQDSRGSLQVVEDAGLVDAVGLGPTVGLVLDTLDSVLCLLGICSDGPTWQSDDWSGGGWEGNRWADDGWTGNRWATGDWEGNRWAGNRWAGDGWTGNRWATGDWSSQRWSAQDWG